MKHTILASLLIGVAAVSAPAFVNSQNVVPPNPVRVGGVGPAVAGSAKVTMIPEKALTFIVEYYPGAGIVSMEKEYASNSYEIELSDGTELEFDSAGNLTDIDSETALADDVVKDILPARAYNQLKGDNLTSNIDSIEVTKNGYNVELNVPEDVEYFFSMEGFSYRKSRISHSSDRMERGRVFLADYQS